MHCVSYLIYCISYCLLIVSSVHTPKYTKKSKFKQKRKPRGNGFYSCTQYPFKKKSALLRVLPKMATTVRFWTCVKADIKSPIKTQCLLGYSCPSTWSRYPPLPRAVLIFCKHRVRPNPINHVCECLISTLLALVSFSWLSARFIMAF